LTLGATLLYTLRFVMNTGPDLDF